MRSNLHDIEVIYQHATERAVCVRAAEDAEDVWFPLSQVEIEAPVGGGESPPSSRRPRKCFRRRG